MTAAVKCAPPGNQPSPDERDACAPFLSREFALLRDLRVVVCLGAFGYEAACRHFGVARRPRFGHGVEVALDTGLTLVCSFHPSQQNTFTGRLTEEMLDAVFAARRGAVVVERSVDRCSPLASECCEIPCSPLVRCSPAWH